MQNNVEGLLSTREGPEGKEESVRLAKETAYKPQEFLDLIT